MTTEKLIIGLVGEKGSGKETAGKLIEELMPQKKVVRVRFSDILAETLTLWNLPLSRHNLQYMAIIMNQQFGATTLSDAMEHRIANIDADIVLIDCIRWESDVVLLRSFPHNKLIYVTADAKIRYERIKQRKEKVGEGGVSFERFQEEELVKTEVLIPSIGKTANVAIHNDSGLEKLREHIKKALVDIA